MSVDRFSKYGLLCAIVLNVLVSIVKTTPNYGLPDYSDLLKGLRSYELIKPYRLQGEIKHHHSTRLSQGGHVDKTTLVFKGTKHNFMLDIELNKGLFTSDYTEHRVLHDGTKVEQKKLDHCFYHGTVRGHNTSSSVSLSTCDGIEAVIRMRDGVFHIEPLASKEGSILDEHLVFSAEDLNEAPVSCGHSPKVALKDKFLDHTKPLNDVKRIRRSVQTEVKYVEFFIINDKAQYEKYQDKTEYRSKQLTNHLDSIYRPKKIRIALVKVETWKDRDLFVIDRNATKALKNFQTYKSKELDKLRGKHWDNVQLITAIDFDGTTVGYAPIQSICGKRSMAVVQDHSSRASITASTMAHELGHNFGMEHDAANCECPSTSSCIMSAYLSATASHFSTCSLNSLRKTLDEGYGSCLFDEPTKLYGPSICGNGFVEEGEQCDCGTKEECDFYKNECCNATTCLLNPGAVCSHGECCDDCQYRSRGFRCRPKRANDECDLPEFCTGDKEMCPEDQHVHDGTSCEDDEGYCYGGICRELTLQCEYLFGPGSKKGADRCFRTNTGSGVDKTKTVFYGCYNETAGKHLCDKKDMKCGKLFCITDKIASPKIGQDRSYVSVAYGGGLTCIVPILNVGDGLFLEYVQDGTKCGTDKMCQGSVCRPLREVLPIPHWESCPNNCSGNGVCNSKGQCHCKGGFACPDCKEKGLDSGGSVDSGQGCEIVESAKSGVNIAAAVLIPLFLIILIVVVVIVFCKRREIADRLSHYKFVRRTVARSDSNAAATHNARSNRDLPTPPKPTISGPSRSFSGANVKTPQQPKNRRPAPSRPNAAPVDEVPRVTVKQPPSSAARRWPPVKPSTNEDTGHESVPLFPPSAAPKEQEPPKPRTPEKEPYKSRTPEKEPYKPRPPPLAPKTQNSPTVPSKPFPGKAKLPPTRQMPTHHSYPDLNPHSPAPQAAAVPRAKPRLPAGSHRSVPDFPDDVPVPKPRSLAVRPGHQSVPLFNLPDTPDEGGDDVTVKPSAVKANNRGRPVPAKRTPDKEERPPVDFRAGLKPVPRPWDKK